jgi:hypothetical protein
LIALAMLSAAPKPEALQLDAGTQKVIEVAKDSTVTTSDSSVLEVKRIGDTQVLLIAMQPGSAKLDARGPGKERKSWAVTVSKHDLRRLTDELRELLGVKGLVVTEGNCVELSCPGCSEPDQALVTQAAGLFPCVRSVHWISLPRKPDEVLAGVRKILGEGPGDTEGLELDVIDGKVVLRGELRSAEDARRVIAARKEFPELRVAVLVEAQVRDAGR